MGRVGLAKVYTRAQPRSSILSSTAPVGAPMMSSSSATSFGTRRYADCLMNNGFTLWVKSHLPKCNCWKIEFGVSELYVPCAWCLGSKGRACSCLCWNHENERALDGSYYYPSLLVTCSFS